MTVISKIFRLFVLEINFAKPLKLNNMKKLMIAALMILGSSAAFAGDSDALKAILKTNSYADAEQLIKQNLNTLANSAEKAKAYNHLVDLAMKVYSDQQAIEQTNMTNKQLGLKKDPQPYDTTAMYNSAVQAIKAGLECYKYDQQPNEKGKVKSKFDGNIARLWGVRTNLVNGGQIAAQKGNAKKVLEYWGKNSLVVYALHFTPLFFLFRYLWEWLQPATIWPFLFFFILLYGLVYGLCWLLMKLFNIKPFKYLTGRF